METGNIAVDNCLKLIGTLSIEDKLVLMASISNTILAEMHVKHPPTKRRFGIAKGKISISDDFDAPLEDFKEYY